MLNALSNMCYTWVFADTCWSLTCTHRAQLVGTLGSKAEGLALMMFFFASSTKEAASRVLQQLVHRQLSQKPLQISSIFKQLYQQSQTCASLLCHILVMQ